MTARGVIGARRRRLVAASTLAGLALATPPTSLSSDPSVRPWPIGQGPRYVPKPRPAPIASGVPVQGLRCASRGPAFRIHFELFADRQVVVIPAGIGVAAPSVRVGGAVDPGGCVYPIRTLDQTGVVEVSRGVSLRLADLFTIWGQTLTTHGLLSFRSTDSVRAYVDGRRYAGPAGSVRLTPKLEIVVEIGAYVSPHRFFLFPQAAA